MSYNIMADLLENFAHHNFSNEKFKRGDCDGDFYIESRPTAYDLSQDRTLKKISIYTVGMMVTEMDAPSEIIKNFSKIIGIENFSNQKYHELFKTFINTLNTNEKFKNIFEPFATDLDDLSNNDLISIKSFDKDDSTYIDTNIFHFTLRCKINNENYSSSLQTYFKFTKNNTIKPIVVFNIMQGSLTIVFDPENQCIRNVTKDFAFYEDYMHRNKALKGNHEIDDLCNYFSKILIKGFQNNNKEDGVFLANSDLTIEEKLNFIRMKNI